MIIEIPSDDQVVAVLAGLADRVTAKTLCAALIADGHPARQSQVAIQRSVERGRIRMNDDWTLSVVREAVAA